MNKKEKQQIKYLLDNLKWYVEAPNEQDYNGEYEPPMEWEQGEAKIFLKYLEKKDKEIERLENMVIELMELYTTEREVKDYYKNIINELEKYLIKIKETSSPQERIMAKYVLEYIEELKGSDSNGNN